MPVLSVRLRRVCRLRSGGPRFPKNTAGHFGSVRCWPPEATPPNHVPERPLDSHWNNNKNRRKKKKYIPRELDVRVGKYSLQRIFKTMRNRQSLLVVLLLIAATLFTYGNSLQNGFVWDDHDIIVNNPVNRDINNIVSLFSSADSTVSGNQKNYYRPLNRLTYLLDYQMFGLHPAGYHAENVMLHLISAILLYFLALKLMGKAAPAFVAALIFAVHPINAEAVNFISARNSLLSALFVLLAAITYLHASANSRKTYYYLSGLFFLIGLLCKEPTFMLPLVLFLFELSDYRTFKTRIKEEIFSFLPFILSAAIYLVLRANALSSVLGDNRILDGFWERLLKNIYIIPKYVMVILFPLRLNALYSLPQNILAEALWLVPLWILIIAFVLILDKKKSVSRFGLLWLVVNFIPISNIVPIPSAPMAERYLYLPAIGLWLIAADQAYVLYGWFRFKKIMIAAGTAVLVCLAAITIARNGDWRDDVIFYTRMAKTNPDSALAHFSLGLAHWGLQEIPEAQAEWKRTTEIDPKYFNVLALLGQSYIRTNSFEEAEYYYARQIDEYPNDAVAVYNMARIEEKLNRLDQALRYYERFIALRPQVDTHILATANARIMHLKEQRLSGKRGKAD
jgi:tetratricopeptide (TPR) repeat protein